jgi:hypothetical protein
MSSNIFIESFIKGLGKTAAALLVCGVTGSILYYISKDENVKKNDSCELNMVELNKAETTETEVVESHLVESQGVIEKYNENIEEYNESENLENNDFDAKKIFDEMNFRKRKWNFM